MKREPPKVAAKAPSCRPHWKWLIGLDAHANLALLLEAAGDIPGARRQFEAALRLQPDHAGFKTSYEAFVARHGGW